MEKFWFLYYVLRAWPMSWIIESSSSLQVRDCFLQYFYLVFQWSSAARCCTTSDYRGATCIGLHHATHRSSLTVTIEVFINGGSLGIFDTFSTLDFETSLETSF